MNHASPAEYNFKRPTLPIDDFKVSQEYSGGSPDGHWVWPLCLKNEFHIIIDYTVYSIW